LPQTCVFLLVKGQQGPIPGQGAAASGESALPPAPSQPPASRHPRLPASSKPMWFVPDRRFTRWSLPPRRDRLLAQAY
jgi:hypothetical protein